MKKRSDKKKGKALFIAGNLVLSILAFSFLIALSSGDVSALGTAPETAPLTPNYDAAMKAGGGVGGTQLPSKVPGFVSSASRTAGNLPTVVTQDGQKYLVSGSGTLKAGETVNAYDVASGKTGQLTLGNPGTGSAFTQGTTADSIAALKSNSALMQQYGIKGISQDGANTILDYGGGKTVTLDASGKVIGQTGEGNSMLSQLFSAPGGGIGDALLTGLQWGAVAAGIGYLIGTIAGMSSHNTLALTLAMGAGAFWWQTFQTLTPANAGALKFLTTQGFLGAYTPFVVGLGIAAAIFIYMYKTESTQTVTFDCKPYEPPTGGKYCELCNKDKFRPCSEYRCKSLGQACQLLNEGTGQEACAWVNPNDVTSPTIIPWQEPLLKGYSYKDVKTRPPGTGMKVVRDGTSDGCVKAFTPLAFGIQTNEPSQCKIDYNHTINVRDVKNAYDSMAYYFGETNIYSYNHSQTMRLPGPAALAAQNVSPEIGLDGTYTLYVRCQDANGNVNEDEFAIRFCVEKGPDTTPPVIEGTSIASGMPVSFNTNDTDLEVYVNEPADCRWSKQDKDYDQMENQMVCDQNVWNINTNMLYKCKTKLTGLENRKDNQFYFRCKDQPYAADQNDRIKNQESYPFVIKGSQPLNIKANSIAPNGTIQGFANVVSVDLTLTTENGYNKGDAICYYSDSNADNSYIQMFETGTNTHKQNQQLVDGTYTYYFKCVDLGGNADYGNTTFTVQIDRSAPQIIRTYNEGSNLRLETDEKSTCFYSENNNLKCNYNIGNGNQMLYANSTVHYTEWGENKNLYVKCTDMSENQPNPTDCSIILRMENQVKSS